MLRYFKQAKIKRFSSQRGTYLVSLCTKHILKLYRTVAPNVRTVPCYLYCPTLLCIYALYILNHIIRGHKLFIKHRYDFSTALSFDCSDTMAHFRYISSSFIRYPVPVCSLLFFCCRALRPLRHFMYKDGAGGHDLLMCRQSSSEKDLCVVFKC